MEWLFAIAFISFLISLASLYLLVWYIRQYRVKGVLVAVLIGAIGVSFINASVPDQQGCGQNGDARCNAGNHQFGVLNSPVFWFLFALLNPEGYEGFMHEATREKTLSTETLARYDLATKRQIFDEIKRCIKIGANVDDTGHYDQAANDDCRNKLAARYGLMRDDLNWIEQEAHRGNLAAPPESLARLDEATKKQIFEAMRRCEHKIHKQTGGYIDEYYSTLLNRCWNDIGAYHGLDRDALEWIDREGYRGKFSRNAGSDHIY